MELRVLGPLEGWDGDAPIRMGPHKQQALLARLLLEPGRVVAVDRLVDDLWGEAVPETAVKMLHNYVSGLRKVLPEGMLATRRPGYVVQLGDHVLDLHRFEHLRRQGAAALERGEPVLAAEQLRAALALWRGAALAEFDEPFASPERAALEERRLACLEDRVQADLALGRHAELVGELETLVARHPLRERLRAQAMIAYYRSGRHGEALAAYRSFRGRLDEELGIEPSAELRRLQVRILQQDPTLEAAVPRRSPMHPEGLPLRRAPALIGRAQEIEALTTALSKATAGSRQVIFLTGEAGIGKSTLVEALLGVAEEAGVLIALGQCVEHHGPSEAYLPVFDALGRLARGPVGELVIRMLDERAPTWLRQMPSLASRASFAALESRTAGASPERMLREMVDLVEGLAAEQPLVLVLEDLHWSDFSTIDLVTALARRHEANQLLLLATYRPAEARGAGRPLHRVTRELSLRRCAIELPLGSLTEEAVREYLASRGIAVDREAFVAAVRARTHGNPLFLEKVADAWREGTAGTDAEDPEGLLAGIPDTLRDLVEQQLVTLQDDEQAILAAASVVGVEAAAASVAAGCERSVEDVESTLEALAERGAFLENVEEEQWPDGTLTGRCRFSHDICQEILYERLSAGRRARLHRRIGLRLEQAYGEQAPEVAAQLASHFVHGRDLVRGVRYLQLAAEQAFRRVAPRDALEHIAWGLDLLPALPNELRSRAELGLRSIEGPALIGVDGWNSEDAERAFLRAREICEGLGALEELQWVLFKLATFYEVRAQYTRSEALLAESFALPVEAPRVGIQIDSHELMACTLFHQGVFSRAVEHADRALELYDGLYSNPLTAAYGDNPAIAANGWGALSLWFLGYADQARDRALAGIDMAHHPGRAAGRAAAYGHAAAIAQLRREPEATLDFAQRGMEAASAAGYRYRVGMAQMLRGWALIQLEEPEEGLADLRAGLAEARTTGVRMDDQYFLGLLADGCAALGRTEEGLAAVREALALRQAQRTFFYAPELHRLHGELMRQAGRPEDARRCFARAIASARDPGSPSLELRATVAYTRELLTDGGAVQEARRALAAARAAVAEGDGTADIRDADMLLTQLATPRTWQDAAP